ncbi:MAG: NADP-dependent isocitrate dehydrogenase, partial [Bacteroidetes bacterium]|nr:NADP-dependent isocitrate dehydrogenase [Bacteroidota bacterium]
MVSQKITMGNDGKIVVPDSPIIPFIEGDGIGPDVWHASKAVIDASITHCYGNKRQIHWKEMLAGEKAFNQTGEWLPKETLNIANDYLVSI